MTGGAGFSKQAEQSLKDNYSLGKIRPRLKFSDQTRTGQSADVNDLNDAVRYRFQRKARLSFMKWSFFSLLIFIILMLIIFS